MSWGRDEGLEQDGGQRAAPDRGFAIQDSQRSRLCGPNLSLAMTPAGAGLEKAPGAIHPHSHNGEKGLRAITPPPFVALPGDGWFGTQPPASPPLCSKRQLQLLPLLSLAPIRSRFQLLVPNPALFPSEPRAEPSSVPTISSC